ncbi:MAG: DUF4097 family beta strand repeat-containing protein, partial [Clostridia bacterium]|nr:DUF4097 family beta strand repeat-containing protein [Clostridia bacterium]
MKNKNSLGKAVYVVGKILAIFLIVAIIGAIIQGVSSIFFNKDDNDTDDESSYISQDYIDGLSGYCLVANLKGTDVTVNSGDKFDYKTNNKNVKVTRQNDKIVITETKNEKKNSKLELTVPKDREFRTVDFSSGAGDVTVNGLYSQELDFELGAGDVTVNNLVVSGSAEIDCGAGNFNVNGGSIKNLELNSGVGDISLSSAFSGDCEINSGIGKVDINVLGNASDYTVTFSKMAGKVSVDGKKVSEDSTIGNGKNE